MAAQLFFGRSIESVETNPKVMSVSVLDKRTKAPFVVAGPLTGLRLSSAFHNGPWVIPPATIVRGRLRFENFWPCHRITCVRVHCSEDEQARTDGNLIVKNTCLCIRFSGEHEHWLHVESFEFAAIGTSRSAREPRAIFIEKRPNRREMLRLFGLEVHIERDQRPIAMIPRSQCFFHDGPDALKEILFHCGLMARNGSAMGDH